MRPWLSRLLPCLLACVAGLLAETARMVRREGAAEYGAGGVGCRGRACAMRERPVSSQLGWARRLQQASASPLERTCAMG